MILPVSTHQEILNHLQPLQDALYLGLIEGIQVSDNAMYLGHETFIEKLELCAKELVDAVQYLGESLLLGGDSVICDAAKHVCQSGMVLAEFQKRIIVVGESDAVGQALWHMVESLQRQVIQWLEQYQKVIKEPEKFQTGDVSLILKLNLEKESVALQELLKKDGKSDLLCLVAAAGLGLWLGGE